MPDPIRTTRLDVPVDENGLPIFVAIEAGEITRYIRSTRLEVPVTEDENGNKIPVVALVGGGVGGNGFTQAYKEKVDTLWEFYSEVETLVTELENLV
jgi:hypothetical protein